MCYVKLTYMYAPTDLCADEESCGMIPIWTILELQVDILKNWVGYIPGGQLGGSRGVGDKSQY